MAKQFKMTKDGQVVYPQSITDAIADTKRKKVLTSVIDGIETDVATNAKNLGDVTTKVNTNTTAVGELKTKTSTLETKAEELEQADVLQEKLTATASVGKVSSGSSFEAGTNVRDIVNAILAFNTPTFASLAINDGSKDYTANATMFCSSDEIRVATIKHNETNVASIKGGKVTLNLNGTKSEENASATSVALTKSAIFTRTANKASFYAELTGTNTLGAAMSARRVTLTAYMPVYAFVTTAQDDATIKGAFASATNEGTVYTATHTIDKTATFVAGGAWCVALPSHLAMSGMGTVADFGFGTQKTEVPTISATRTVNGIADVPYTIYVLGMGTAQTSLPVRIITKAK